MNLIDYAPAFLSAIASVAAAIAAFGSLQISRQSKLIAKQSALASHHNSAAIQLSSALQLLRTQSKEFSEFNYSMWVDWSREIQAKDNCKLGGTNPRPLRHVLTNASEMLANYGYNRRNRYTYVQRSILSVIREGVCNLNDTEYDKLLRKADGEYSDFESIFGTPPLSKSISTAPAFRWACYQMNKRVTSEDWQKIWESAWLENGWLYRYAANYSEIYPIVETVLKSLKSEKSKLEHGVFPLESNSSLCTKYNQLIDMLEAFINDSNIDQFEIYRNWSYEEE
ncbi:hypothetical protein [Desulfosediminicola flagellatus]|uniref:hypothetical protein n=1 Tax=Desulfosediminicola flagellatus TaxID=2569541 RepID=UPI0010ABA7DD|nr:hypothetical protein [Desulfosediminicola flagellatus]